jgi:hypothetical protein
MEIEYSLFLVLLLLSALPIWEILSRLLFIGKYGLPIELIRYSNNWGLALLHTSDKDVDFRRTLI